MPSLSPCVPQTSLRLIPSSRWSRFSPRLNKSFSMVVNGGWKRESERKPSLLLDEDQPKRLSRVTKTIRAIDHTVQSTATATTSTTKLNIGILGFGNFGQFMSKTLVSQGHSVIAHSRSDYSNVAKDLGIPFFSDPHDFCKQQPEVIILCTSIISTKYVISAFPFQLLKKSTLFVDVLSVKEYAQDLLPQLLPPEFDILCTHPMFGPQSGKHGWNGLFFVYDKVRIRDESRCDSFLDIFAREGCKMVPMSCHEHDKWSAKSQFITHFVGRTLGMLSLTSTPINTKGYEALLDLVKNTKEDSFELFYGLFMYNKNALEELESFDKAYQSIKKQLFAQLHGVVREQLFGNVIPQEESNHNHRFPVPSEVTLQDNYIGKECNLRVGWPLRTVASGILQQGLEEDNFKVYVTAVHDPEIELPHPHDHPCTTLGHLGQGSIIIWPKEALQWKHS